MRALLLAAGLGTRLRPLTDTIPKCLVPIVGKPLLEYWFKLLSDAGVHPVLVNTHYFPEKVMAHIENSRFSSIVKIVHEDELLGTAGTLLANRDFFGDEPLMLIHADNLSKFNEIIEEKPEHGEIEKRRRRQKYEGAFVFQPVDCISGD